MIKLTDIEDNREFLLNLNQIKAMFDQGDGVTRVVAEYHNFNVRETLQEIERLMLRDQFAMSALNGLLSNSGGVVQANSYSGTGYANGSAEYTALWAYELADAMLEERGK